VGGSKMTVPTIQEMQSDDVSFANIPLSQESYEKIKQHYIKNMKTQLNDKQVHELIKSGYSPKVNDVKRWGDYEKR